MCMLLSDVTFVILLLYIRNWSLATSACLQLMHNLELLHIVYNIWCLYLDQCNNRGRTGGWALSDKLYWLGIIMYLCLAGVKHTHTGL